MNQKKKRQQKSSGDWREEFIYPFIFYPSVSTGSLIPIDIKDGSEQLHAGVRPQMALAMATPPISAATLLSPLFSPVTI